MKSIFEKIKNIIKLIRPRHYIKNILIFLPLFFSGKINNANKMSVAVLGFISFCLLASIVYVINDLKDIENDKINPTKKDRPLASGKINKKEAITIIILLLFLMCSINIVNLKLNNISMNQFILSISLEFLYLILNIT